MVASLLFSKKAESDLLPTIGKIVLIAIILIPLFTLFGTLVSVFTSKGDESSIRNFEQLVATIQNMQEGDEVKSYPIYFASDHVLVGYKSGEKENAIHGACNAYDYVDAPANTKPEKCGIGNQGCLCLCSSDDFADLCKDNDDIIRCYGEEDFGMDISFEGGIYADGTGQCDFAIFYGTGNPTTLYLKKSKQNEEENSATVRICTKECGTGAKEIAASSGDFSSSNAACSATGGVDAYENAFLDMISWAEGADYNTLVGGGTFDDCSTHPNEDVYIERLKLSSDAAGRYQFIYNTYVGLKEKGLFSEDFCAGSQDAAALYLIHTTRGVSATEIQEAFASGYGSQEWQDVLDALALEWASFPMSTNACEAQSACKSHECAEGSGCYGQGAKDDIDLFEEFKTCYEFHSAASTTLVSTSTQNSEKNVLIIGDSQTMGTYGDVIYTSFKENQYTANQYAVCGATPSYFMKESPIISSSCNAEYVYDDGTEDGREEEPTSGNTPLLSDLLTKHNPTLVFVTFGSNLYPYEEESRKIQVTYFAKEIAIYGVTCYWVGPPQGPRYADLDEYRAHKKVIQDAAEQEGCVFIDSEAFSAFNFCGDTAFGCFGEQGIDVHFDNNGDAGKAAAIVWAEGVYSAFEHKLIS